MARKPQFVSYNDLQTTESKLVGDKQLENWQRWMKHRWQIVKRITQKIQRPLETSIMNISEELRDINQDKILFEYTKITTKFDKYRGNPAFWKIPFSLKDPCSGPYQSNYQAVKTKDEQGVIPPIEYVKVPDLIQQEKHTQPRSRNLYKSWQRSEYREEKLKKLSTKIAKILPHEPHCENLIIIGQKIGKSYELNEPSDEKFVSRQPSECSHHNSLNSEHLTRLALRINDVDITDTLFKNQKTIVQSFEYDLSSVNSCGIKYLKLINIGRVALRVSFKQLPEFKLFKAYTPTDRSGQYAFNFDSNEHLVIPEQTVEIPVYFTSLLAGFYREAWEVLVRPKFWNCQITVVFVSRASLNIPTMKIKEIQTHVDTVTRERVLNEVIEDLINRVGDSIDMIEFNMNQEPEE